MKFETIKIRNFLSFVNAEYCFSNNGLTLITGLNKDNGNRSNGSGKSSLTEALVWCLFGETTKRLKSSEILNRSNDHDCMVELDIEANSGQYKVIRYRSDTKYGNDVQFYINGFEKKGKNNNETQEIINQELGIDYKLFVNSVVFPQETKFKFITATDSEKKAILTDLLDLNYIDKAQEKINDKIKCIESEITEETYQEQSIQEMIAAYKEEKSEISSKHSYWSTHQKTRIMEKGLEIQDLYKRIENYQSTMFDMDMLLEIKDKLLVLLDKEEKINSYEEKKELLKDKFYEIKERLTHYQSIIDPLEQEIKKIKTIGVGECSKCFQNVPKDHIADLLELKTIKLKEIKPKAELICEKLDEYKAKIKKVSEIIYKKPIVKEKIKQYQEQLTENDKIANQIENIEKEIALEVKVLDSLKKETNPFIGMSDNIDVKISKLEEKCGKIKQNIHENNELLKYYHYWKEGFSNKGIKSFVFNGIVSELNDKIEQYLDEMFDGMLKIDLDTESSTSKGEIRQKLSTNIKYMDEDVSYESLSGGEKRSISLAVDLALSSVVAQYNQKTFDILILDECVDHLDDIGKERFLDLLKTMEKDSIFVISHDLTFQQKFNNIINIHKENGESYIA